MCAAHKPDSTVTAPLLSVGTLYRYAPTAQRFQLLSSARLLLVPDQGRSPLCLTAVSARPSNSWDMLEQAGGLGRSCERGSTRPSCCTCNFTARLVSPNHVPLQQTLGHALHVPHPYHARTSTSCAKRASMGCAQNAGTSSAYRNSIRVHRLSSVRGRVRIATDALSGAQTHALTGFHTGR